jgi:hypothetical protein
MPFGTVNNDSLENLRQLTSGLADRKFRNDMMIAKVEQENYDRTQRAKITNDSIARLKSIKNPREADEIAIDARGRLFDIPGSEQHISAINAFSAQRKQQVGSQMAQESAKGLYKPVTKKVTDEDISPLQVGQEMQTGEKQFDVEKLRSMLTSDIPEERESAKTELSLYQAQHQFKPQAAGEQPGTVDLSGRFTPTGTQIPSKPTPDRKLGEVIGKDNRKVATFMRADGTTYTRDLGEERAPATGINDGIGFGKLSTPEQDTWYEQYLLKDKVPPFAYRDAASRDAFTKGYANYLIRKGINPTEGALTKIKVDALRGSLNLQQKSSDAIGGFVSNLNQQIDRVGKMKSDIIGRVGTRALDLPMREWKTKFVGSGNEQILGSYLMEISNEIGKISTGSQASIAELSTTAQERWNKIHDPNLSLGELMKVLDATREQANMRDKSVKQQILKIIKEMSELGTSGKNPTTPIIPKRTKALQDMTDDELKAYEDALLHKAVK